MEQYESMLKPALVDLAVERGVIKNKSAGRGSSKQELIEQLAAQDRIATINKANAQVAPTEPAPAEPEASAQEARTEPTTHDASGTAKLVRAPEPAPAFVPHGGSRVSILAPATDPRHPAYVPPALAVPPPAPKPAPIPGIMAEERKRPRLTTEQRANKLRRNKRRHKRALLRARNTRTTGQGPIHA